MRATSRVSRCADKIVGIFRQQPTQLLDRYLRRSTLHEVQLDESASVGAPIALLLGLGANALAIWWSADPLTALVIAEVALKEGRAAKAAAIRADRTTSALLRRAPQ